MFDPVVDNPFERFKAFFIGLALIFLSIFFIKIFKWSNNTESYSQQLDEVNYAARADFKRVYDSAEVTTLSQDFIKEEATALISTKPSPVISKTTKAPKAN